jgi:death-on-curing protein
MTVPVWLTRALVDAVHQELLARFGGLSGVRDEGLLESALARPEHLYSYEDPTLFALAASYAYGIVKNHPFIDGNKRVGYMAAYVFLGANGFDITAPEEEVVIQTLALAASECSEAEYAEWLETACGMVE